MATYAPRPAAALRVRSMVGASGAAVAVPLVVVAALSVLLRTQHMGVGFWIDEGLSVGIADRSLTDIPGTMRQDGSPPLYYMLLHVWMAVAGRTEEATHALSLVFAVACVPAAFLLARGLFGMRVAWIAAALAAANPFLTVYAQETRMYTQVAFFALLATGAFLYAFVERRRAWLVPFAGALAALFYTHNWGLFFGAAAGVAWLGLVALEAAAERRALLRDGVIAFGCTLLLYAAWVPTLLFQAAHTGAPWSRRPGIDQLTGVPERLLGEVPQAVLLLAAGAGLAAVVARRADVGRLTREAKAAIVLVVLSAGTILIAFGASQVSPSWANRYLVVGLMPLLLLAALGLGRAGRLGLAGLAIVLIVFAGMDGPGEKSNVRSVAGAIGPSLRDGDLVVSTQPEQIPVLDYYLPDGLRYATLTGPVRDLGVTDWRDGVERLRATSAERDLRPLLDRVAPGQRVILIEPTVYDIGRWSAPWTELVRLRSEEWSEFLTSDERFRVTAIQPVSPFPPHPNPVRATVFLREGGGARGSR
jgi:mannosyltransferase